MIIQLKKNKIILQLEHLKLKVILKKQIRNIKVIKKNLIKIKMNQ